MSELRPRLPTTNGRVAPIAPELNEAIETFAAAAVRASSVDPVTMELVRHRCAGYHDCRRCGSLRLEDARQAGVDEEMITKTSSYESSDLPERVKVALRLVDAVIIDPRDASSELAEQLHQHFSDVQIAELLLDIMKWSRQKELVALRLEAPRWSGIEVLTFDDAGDAVIGASALSV
jgi:alkylhydroperoxidase family enzyme